MSVRDVPRVTVLARRLEFGQRHPQVTITPSSQSGSGLWEADWPGQGEDEPARHDTCTGLLDYLEARFDRGDLSGAPGDTDDGSKECADDLAAS